MLVCIAKYGLETFLMFLKFWGVRTPSKLFWVGSHPSGGKRYLSQTTQLFSTTSFCAFDLVAYSACFLHNILKHFCFFFFILSLVKIAANTEKLQPQIYKKAKKEHSVIFKLSYKKCFCTTKSFVLIALGGTAPSSFCSC